MSNHAYRGGPDWFGRLMALGGIAVGAVALWYAYDRSQHMLTRDEAAPELKTQLQDWTRDFAALKQQQEQAGRDRQRDFDTLLASLERKFNDSLTALANKVSRPDQGQMPWVGGGRDSSRPPEAERTEGDLGLSPIDDTARRDSESDRVLAQDDRPSSAGEGDQTEEAHEDRLALSPTDEPATSDLAPPELMLVRTALRPTGDEQSVTATIRNIGKRAAAVREVRFRPQTVIEGLSAEAARNQPRASGPSDLAIRFLPADNTSLQPDRHGVYIHRLATAHTIPAGTTVDIVAGIEGPDHLGYGLRGQFVLILEEGDPFTVSDAALAFLDKAR